MTKQRSNVTRRVAEHPEHQKVEEFIFRKTQIRPAIKRMIAESRDHKTYSNAEDFFNELDEDEG